MSADPFQRLVRLHEQLDPGGRSLKSVEELVTGMQAEVRHLRIAVDRIRRAREQEEWGDDFEAEVCAALDLLE